MKTGDWFFNEIGRHRAWTKRTAEWELAHCMYLLIFVFVIFILEKNIRCRMLDLPSEDNGQTCSQRCGQRMYMPVARTHFSGWGDSNLVSVL